MAKTELSYKLEVNFWQAYPKSRRWYADLVLKSVAGGKSGAILQGRGKTKKEALKRLWEKIPAFYEAAEAFEQFRPGE